MHNTFNPASPATVPAAGPRTAGAVLADYAGDWALDPAATTITLKTRSMRGLLPVRGTFRAIRGTARARVNGHLSARLEVDAASLRTGLKIRDGHLRGGDFLAVASHPAITIDIEHAEITDATTVAGVLHARGTSVPVRFPVTVTRISPDEAEVSAQVLVNRSQLGITTRANGATTMACHLTVHGTSNPPADGSR